MITEALTVQTTDSSFTLNRVTYRVQTLALLRNYLIAQLNWTSTILTTTMFGFTNLMTLAEKPHAGTKYLLSAAIT